MVTGNSSQSAVSPEAAEEDVDTFILKPYTIEIFSSVCFLKAAMAKLYPSDYMKKNR
jgi:hypothetical protein